MCWQAVGSLAILSQRATVKPLALRTFVPWTVEGTYRKCESSEAFVPGGAQPLEDKAHKSLCVVVLP